MLALELLERLPGLVTHDAIDRTSVQAVAVQGLLQHADLRAARMHRPRLIHLLLTRLTRCILLGVLVLVGVLIRVLVGILLLRHGRDCQGNDGDQRNKCFFIPFTPLVKFLRT